MIGSSVALAISDIPWDGPTGSVQVGRVDGRMIVTESRAEGKIRYPHDRIRHQRKRL